MDFLEQNVYPTLKNSSVTFQEAIETMYKQRDILQSNRIMQDSNE